MFILCVRIYQDDATNLLLTTHFAVASRFQDISKYAYMTILVSFDARSDFSDAINYIDYIDNNIMLSVTQNIYFAQEARTWRQHETLQWMMTFEDIPVGLFFVF